MSSRHILKIALFLSLLLAIAAGVGFVRWYQVSAGADPEPFVELDWDALIPEDWRPEALLEQLDTDAVPDDDPRALEIMDRIAALWRESPVVASLDGQRVRLPGFVVPLEFGQDDIREFLLVPYYGACIHVPPPPTNQTVHVVLPRGKPYRGGLFDILWVSGILRVERFSSDLADAGYRIEAVQVEPYE